MKIRRIIGTCIVLLLLFAVAIGATTNVKLQKNVEVKENLTSFKIAKKNIDLGTVYDTRPLNEYEINYLSELGYSKNKISKLDRGEFQKIELAQVLTDTDIKYIIEIYPELKEKKIDKWTYMDYQKYEEEVYKNENKLNEKELEKISKKGLTDDDALYLLKYYPSIDAILEEDVTVLIDIINNFYDIKNEYLEMMNSYEEENLLKDNLFAGFVSRSHAAPIHPENYITVPYFAGYVYPNDLFHINSNTQYSTVRINQEYEASRIYKSAYKTLNSPSFANLWGTFSATSQGAHEGIDMSMYEGASIYNPVPKTLTVTKEYHSPISTLDYIVVFRGGNMSYFFIHMSEESVNSSTLVPLGQYIGKQGKRYPDPTVILKSHLHYAVEYGNTTSTHTATNDDNLDSANPYIY